jgi:hypothetical protein
MSQVDYPNLVRVSPSERWSFQTRIMRTAAYPQYFCIEGKTLSLFYTPGAEVTITVSYEVRQPKLVTTSACALVQAAFSGSSSIVGSPPATFTTLGPDSLTQAQLWVVRTGLQWSVPYGLTAARYCDVATTGVGNVGYSSDPTSSTTVTDAAVVRSADYICLWQETPQPFIPAECNPVLWQATAAAILRVYGASDAYQACQAELDRKKGVVANLLKERADEAPLRVGAVSPLAGRRYGRNWW